MRLALLLVLWLHLLQAPFLMLIFVVDRFKLHCTRSSFFTCYPGYVRNNFMFILWSISYSLQGTGCSYVC